MDCEKLFDYLCIIYAPYIGVISVKFILKSNYNFKKFIKNPADFKMPRKLPVKSLEYFKEGKFKKANNAIKWLQKEDNNYILSLYDDRYPKLLKEINDSPSCLYVKGNLDLLNSKQIAVIGTRNFTKYGEYNTKFFTNELINYNYTITSGLAKGIDSIAYQACIDSKGKTMAVLGTGIDIIYPSDNTKLVNDIIDNNGAVITEFALNTAPSRLNFPMRNRIISGLSLGILVIESPKSGGSLITAKLALDHNRDVFAIPGNIYNENNKGTNDLIKQGAILVDCIEDIIDLINHDIGNKKEKTIDNKVNKPIISGIKNTPVKLNKDTKTNKNLTKSETLIYDTL